MLDTQQVAQALAGHLEAKALATLARCSNSFQAAYMPLAKQARSRQLWQKARLTLHLPPARWVQHVLGPESSILFGSLVTGNPRGTTINILDYLLRTLRSSRQDLSLQLSSCCCTLHVSLKPSSFVIHLLKQPGPLTQNDKCLLRQLLHDHESYQQRHAALPYRCRRGFRLYELRMTAAEYHLMHIVPVYLLQLLLVRLRM